MTTTKNKKYAFCRLPQEEGHVLFAFKLLDPKYCGAIIAVRDAVFDGEANIKFDFDTYLQDGTVSLADDVAEIIADDSVVEGILQEILLEIATEDAERSKKSKELGKIIHDEGRTTDTEESPQERDLHTDSSPSSSG